jgi:hypothetical protein
MNTTTAKHMAAIRAASRPVEQLTEPDIALVILALCVSDGALIDSGMPAGNVALVVASESGRRLVIFGSDATLTAFATRYGLVMETVDRGQAH